MPNFYRLMHENEIETPFEITPDIVSIIDQANDHEPAHKILEGLTDFGQRVAFIVETNE